MKVSIVSLFGYFNYGNRLQNYAVQEVLHSLGCKTQVIYVQTFRESIKNLIKSIIYYFGVYRWIKNADAKEIKLKKEKKFRLFNKKFINIKLYSSVSDIEDVDFFILGSDQVWNPKRYNEIKKQLFFLTFAEPSKRICFSPSFGLSAIPLPWKNYFKEKLMEFPRLSVREKRGAQIIKELTGRDAEVLIDPTLMLDKEQWLKIAKRPKNVNFDSKYVFNYFLGDMPDKAKLDGKRMCEELKGNIYNIMDPNTPDLYISDPAEFLYLIEHAAIVQTDSFHACVFSFLFGKPFLLYAREGKDTDMFSRMETLFSTFGLKRKFVDSGLKNEIYECDYTYGYEKLNAEREKVIIFLKQSMGIID